MAEKKKKNEIIFSAVGPACFCLLLCSCGVMDAPGSSRALFAERTEGCCSPDEEEACQDGIFCNGREVCTCWGTCELGPPVNCDDGKACTYDTCMDDEFAAPGTGMEEGHCEHVCVESDVCECEDCGRPSDCYDGNACTDEECVDGACVFMDASCDDGDACTVDSCDPLTGCHYVPIAGCCTLDEHCDDGAACTVDVCDTDTLTCGNEIVEGACLIAGACYGNGELNPANACRQCRSDVNPVGWDARPAGTSCDDGLYCTVTDTCTPAGECVGSGSPCGDGLACTDDLCNEAEDSCLFPVLDGFCAVAGVCYDDGDINPANACRVCSSAESRSSWGNRTAGTACDDGLLCTLTDVCDAGGFCGGTGNPCDDGETCTQDICNEAEDSCFNPVVPGCP